MITGRDRQHVADVPFESPHRGYHSQSFLLRDGRVYLGAGGNTGGGAIDHFDYALFEPPYLFKGPRPDIEIDDTVNDIGWMDTNGFPIVVNNEQTASIARVVLVKLSASTHQFDQEQRFVELEFDDLGGTILAYPPLSTCYATPGY